MQRRKATMAEETHWADEVFAEVKRREIQTVCTIPDGGDPAANW